MRRSDVPKPVLLVEIDILDRNIALTLGRAVPPGSRNHLL
jgi:D-serine deaminase-like pyridoxal phosphate-dependent protein